MAKKNKTRSKRKAAARRGRSKATRRKAPRTKAKRTPSPKPRARIEKTFKGRQITVKVTADGFEYAGKTYPSLTSLAMHITGYRAVSGPRFFGLAKPSTAEGR